MLFDFQPQFWQIGDVASFFALTCHVLHMGVAVLTPLPTVLDDSIHFCSLNQRLAWMPFLPT